MKNLLLTAKYSSLMSYYLSGKQYWKYGDELYQFLYEFPKEHIILLEGSIWLRGNLKYIPEDTPWEIRENFICLDDVINIDFSLNRTMLVFLRNGYLLAISPSGHKVAYMLVYPQMQGSCIKLLLVEIRLRLILLRWYWYD